MQLSAKKDIPLESSASPGYGQFGPQLAYGHLIHGIMVNSCCSGQPKDRHKSRIKISI